MTKLDNPKIIIAACRVHDLIILCPRHWDKVMHTTINNHHKSAWVKRIPHSEWEQGFIDQFGKFYSREEAMLVVKRNEQPFSPHRNVSTTKLYSEGIY